MRKGSILYDLYREANADNPSKVRSVNDLLDKGYTGLAESVVAKYFRAKLAQKVQKEGIRVNQNGASFYI